MILHRFVCDECGKVVEDTETYDVHICPVCNAEMRWDIKPRIRGNYKNPVHSDALAVHPDQRAEHEQMFPNIELDAQNRPVFDNYADHHAYLEKCNMTKVTQKIRGGATFTKKISEYR